MASSVITFDVAGLDELERALDELELVASKKVIRKAVRKGVDPVLTEIKQSASSRWGEMSGALNDSIKVRVSAPKRQTWADIIASVGVFRLKPIEQLAAAWYPDGYIGAPTLAHWFEYGVQPHSLGGRSRAGTSRSTGALHPGIPAKPVIRPAMDNNVDIVISRTASVLGDEIDRIRNLRNRR